MLLLGKWFELLKRGEGDVSLIRYERVLQFEFTKNCFQKKHLKGSRDVHISNLFSEFHVSFPVSLLPFGFPLAGPGRSWLANKGPI
jgi:hypothetical protein